ncbi:hypothetical protein AB0H49_06195 [Nocardia sp. NPDC050713]|uniref:F0F1 ATP synthase subunit B family protein n=1 Tax=Nocardia sp. NPDC050713 TaxID=3154511 RepID=UPI0034055A09
MNTGGGVYDITWDWPVFVSQLFGFAVILGALSKWVAPQVRTVMRKAQRTIEEQMTESADAATELAAAERAFAKAVAAAQVEVARIGHQARDDADRIVTELRDTAAAEVERVRREGLRNVALAHRQLEEELTHDLTTAVIDRAESIARDLLESPLARSSSIDRFLDELTARARATEDLSGLS